MSPLQRKELELLARRSIEWSLVDGRVRQVLLRKKFIETFHGDTYSMRTIVGITEAGREALAAST